MQKKKVSPKRKARSKPKAERKYFISLEDMKKTRLCWQPYLLGKAPKNCGFPCCDCWEPLIARKAAQA
jgi:hypothetical protein